MTRSLRCRRLLASLALSLTASPLPAGDLLSREEALAAVYPGASVEAERVFLTDAQVAEVSALSGVTAPRPLVARYVARRDGAVVGRAYVDTHVVRTKRESLLVSLSAEGRVRRVDVTAFFEPREYLASRPWLNQYEGHALDADLGLQRGIRSIAGATVTASAATDAVRRVLAIDRVLAGEDSR